MDGSAPAELRGDKREDAPDGVGVVVDAQLVRDGQEQRVGGGDGLVLGELFDQHIGLGGVRAAENRAGVRVDVADPLTTYGFSADCQLVTTTIEAFRSWSPTVVRRKRWPFGDTLKALSPPPTTLCPV